MFDSSSFLPTPRNWLSTDIEYEGRGRAKFYGQDGWVEGVTKIGYGERGDSHITLAVEGHQGVDPFARDDTGKMVPLPTCSSLEVDTPEGVFSAIDEKGILYERNPFSPLRKGLLAFHPLSARFDAEEATEAKYWVLPISNFIPNHFPQAPQCLDNHPLRFFWPPSIPEELSGDEKEQAVENARSRNHLITFEYAGGKGFIENVHDFSERMGKLMQGTETDQITAVMV